MVGPADCGKTYASTSFGLKGKRHGGDDPREALLWELDGRIAALRGRPVMFDSFTNEEGADGVLKSVIAEREYCVKYKKAQYHTYILSSATSFGDFAVADSLEATDKDKGRTKGEQKLLTMEDYGYEAEAFRKLLWENLQDIKRYADVILEFHEVPLYKKEPISPGSKIMESTWDGYSYKLLLHGNKIASRLPTKFDEVYHWKAKEPLPSTGGVRRGVTFVDNVGRTSIPALAKLGSRLQDMSGKEFYPWWREQINAI